MDAIETPLEQSPETRNDAPVADEPRCPLCGVLFSSVWPRIPPTERRLNRIVVCRHCQNAYVRRRLAVLEAQPPDSCPVRDHRDAGHAREGLALGRSLGTHSRDLEEAPAGTPVRPPGHTVSGLRVRPHRQRVGRLPGVRDAYPPAQPAGYERIGGGLPLDPYRYR